MTRDGGPSPLFGQKRHEPQEKAQYDQVHPPGKIVHHLSQNRRKFQQCVARGNKNHVGRKPNGNERAARSLFVRGSLNCRITWLSSLLWELSQSPEAYWAKEGCVEDLLHHGLPLFGGTRQPNAGGVTGLYARQVVLVNDCVDEDLRRIDQIQEGTIRLDCGVAAGVPAPNKRCARHGGREAGTAGQSFCFRSDVSLELGQLGLVQLPRCLHLLDAEADLVKLLG